MSIIKASLVGLVLAAPCTALAQPGFIDPSFGGGSVLVAGPWGPNANGTGFGALNAIVVQSTGKAVGVGKCNAPNGMGAIRFNLDGTIDTTFGQGGSVNVVYPGNAGSPFSCIAGGALAAVVAPNDRIVMLDGSFQLVRLMPNGALDATFGSGGVVSMCGLNRRSWAGASVAIQADGKIVVVGDSFSERGRVDHDLTIVRFTPSGALDTTFANFGHGSTPGYLVDAQAGIQTAVRGSLLIQPNGRMVIGVNSSDAQCYLARYLPTGALDTSFGINGKRAFSFSGGHDPARGLALTSDGRIVLASIQGATIYVARFTSGGALDGTYGASHAGWMSIAVPPHTNLGMGIALQSDGSALLPLSWPQAGGSSTGQATIRLTPYGALDTGFGPWSNGLSQLGSPIIGPGQVGIALLLDPLGRIILAGSHFDGFTGGAFVTAIQQ